MASDRFLLDSSIVIGLLGDEIAARPWERLVMAADVAISAPTLLEIRIVMAKRKLSATVTPFLLRYDVTILPFGAPEAALAEEAHLRFGKGIHPAKLNFGDCMAYAASRTSVRPLLFIGGDFTKTDVQRVEF